MRSCGRRDGRCRGVGTSRRGLRRREQSTIRGVESAGECRRPQVEGVAAAEGKHMPRCADKLRQAPAAGDAASPERGSASRKVAAQRYGLW